jgi:adenylyl cyclase-associated protein
VQVEHLNKALAEHRKLLVVASKSKKPSDADFQKLVAGMVGAAGAIGQLKDQSRTSKVFNHLSAVADGIGALNWVAITPTPAPFIGDMIGGAEFYTNRILKDFKGKDETQVAWAQGWSTFLRELQKYVKANHTTGLSWKANGGDALAAWNASGSAAPAAAAAPAGAPAPPPPPPASLPEPSSNKGPDPAAAAAGVFAALNSGNVTGGLRKVTDDMKVYKNPALKAQGPVVEKAAVAAPKPAAAKAAPKKGPAKTALEGNKWLVENHDGGEHTIDITDFKQTIYVYKCDKVFLKINGKFNAITIDGCKTIVVSFTDAIATCEVVNTSGFKVQFNKVPAVTIDKCSNGQLYLSKESFDTDIITSKSDAINVVLPAKSEAEDPVEMNIPEQFLTKVKNYTLHTESVKHTGV